MVQVAPSFGEGEKEMDMIFRLLEYLKKRYLHNSSVQKINYH
jgi:hypothetical protein